MGPACLEDEERWPDGEPVHESCAGVLGWAEGEGWMFLGRTVPMSEMPG